MKETTSSLVAASYQSSCDRPLYSLALWSLYNSENIEMGYELNFFELMLCN